MIKIGDIITKEMVDNVVNDVVQETTFSIKGLIYNFGGNIKKRLNTGYGFLKSLSGAVQESSGYMDARLCGREYAPTKEAIIFEKKRY